MAAVVETLPEGSPQREQLQLALASLHSVQGLLHYGYRPEGYDDIDTEHDCIDDDDSDDDILVDEQKEQNDPLDNRPGSRGLETDTKQELAAT